jgi:hypothetical protein
MRIGSLFAALLLTVGYRRPPLDNHLSLLLLTNKDTHLIIPHADDRPP